MHCIYITCQSERCLCLQIEEAAKVMWSCIYYFLHWFKKVLELFMVLKHTVFSLQVFAARAYLPIPVISLTCTLRKARISKTTKSMGPMHK